MEYNYSFEDIANIHIEYNDLDTNTLYILCYHVETECKYPFLQFLMEKIPFCNNLIKEQFVLPHIILNKSEQNIKNMALDKVKHCLHSIGYDARLITDDMYKGVVLGTNLITPYIFVNISDIKINGLFLSRNSSCWPILPSEIINTKQVCGIDIDMGATRLFTENPRLGILTNSKTKEIYNLPDGVYTGGEYKSVEFNSIFGNKKQQIYDSCGRYFYFHRSFLNAVYDVQSNVIENSQNKYGINRYALFVEGEIYIEMEDEFSLTEDIIEKKYPEPCIIIGYSNRNAFNANILVKDYDNFISISYHSIDNLMSIN